MESKKTHISERNPSPNKLHLDSAVLTSHLVSNNKMASNLESELKSLKKIERKLKKNPDLEF